MWEFTIHAREIIALLKCIKTIKKHRNEVSQASLLNLA